MERRRGRLVYVLQVGLQGIYLFFCLDLKRGGVLYSGGKSDVSSLWKMSLKMLPGSQTPPPKVQGDLSSIYVYSSLHWTSHFLQGTRKTRPCLTGHPVYTPELSLNCMAHLNSSSEDVTVVRKPRCEGRSIVERVLGSPFRLLQRGGKSI